MNFLSSETLHAFICAIGFFGIICSIFLASGIEARGRWKLKCIIWVAFQAISIALQTIAISAKNSPKVWSTLLNILMTCYFLLEVFMTVVIVKFFNTRHNSEIDEISITTRPSWSHINFWTVFFKFTEIK